MFGHKASTIGQWNLTRAKRFFGPPLQAREKQQPCYRGSESLSFSALRDELNCLGALAPDSLKAVDRCHIITARDSTFSATKADLAHPDWIYYGLNRTINFVLFFSLQTGQRLTLSVEPTFVTVIQKDLSKHWRMVLLSESNRRPKQSEQLTRPPMSTNTTQPKHTSFISSLRKPLTPVALWWNSALPLDHSVPTPEVDPIGKSWLMLRGTTGSTKVWPAPLHHFSFRHHKLHLKKSRVPTCS